MNRREFLFAGGLLAAAGCVTKSKDKVAESVTDVPEKEIKPLLASAPVLQNAAETSIGVSFAVSADACGWVEIGERADLSDARRVYAGVRGLRTVDDHVALIRVTGLKPATRYHYRIGADRISYKGGYAMKNLGSEVDEEKHSFVTLGTAATGSFCVINDTHNQKDALDAVLSKVEAIKPSVTIWNGDASNTSEVIDDAMDIFIHTHSKHPEYAADTPYMFLNGNHDYRGRFNRQLDKLIMCRETAERSAQFADLGRNFVQRLGDIALIGLDTGEDKLDTNPIFAGLFEMQEYREQQTRWLAEVVKSPQVRTAKFKVVFCHIPLYDSNPTANPGDIAPADTSPRYTTNYAVWQRTCAKLWSPYFEQAGVQLVITAHQHRFRFDEPASGHRWAQIVGGGCEFGVSSSWSEETGLVEWADPTRFPTVIEGRVEGEALRILVHDLYNHRIVFDRSFK